MARKETDEQKLLRANKLTVVWSGEDGIAIGRFYKTHDKLAEVRSDNPVVVNAGFKMPETTEENPVTPQQKLESYKNFLGMNAGLLGIHYDPVDRRSDEFKYPSRYDQDTFKEYSAKHADSAISAVVQKVRDGVIGKMIEAGHIPADTKIDYGISDDAVIEIAEQYKNGGIKYATAEYDVIIQIENEENGVQQVQDKIKVELVSGQLRKPRSMENISLTQTAFKTALVENGILPKIERKSKAKDADADAGEDADNTEDSGQVE